ncbi:MAG: amidohydrolase family protein, partial [Candidatus Diapherotrites archaeon]|nr:amidohydrolase family protein [Candidatus Diapherotrites archaeon]
MRIDTHVHFRDGDQSYKETIKHGLMIAKEQGVEYVFDMPNTLEPILRKEDVEKRLELVPESEKGRYFLYIGATINEDQLKEAVSLVNEKKEVIGIKMFAGKSTGDLQILSEEEQKKVYQILTDNNYTGVISIHCEKEAFMTDTFDPSDPITHATSRPKEAEIESVKDQIRFVKETNFKGTLNICHVSCAESVELVNEAKKEIKITCEVTPHHGMWDYSKLEENNGLLYKMNPPLRSKEDVQALQECIKLGKIDFIGTDHAPHTIGEKLYGPYPSGCPSLYTYKLFVCEFLPSIG